MMIFEYCCNRSVTRRALLSPSQPASQQRDFCSPRTAALSVAGLWNIWLPLPLAIILLPFNFAPMRKSLFSAPAFRAFRKVMPPMSRTEKKRPSMPAPPVGRRSVPRQPGLAQAA